MRPTSRSSVPPAMVSIGPILSSGGPERITRTPSSPAGTSQSPRNGSSTGPSLPAAGSAMGTRPTGRSAVGSDSGSAEETSAWVDAMEFPNRLETVQLTVFAFPPYALPAIVVGTVIVIVPCAGRKGMGGGGIPGNRPPALLGSGFDRSAVTSSVSATAVRLCTWNVSAPAVFASAAQEEGAGQTSGRPPYADVIGALTLATCRLLIDDRSTTEIVATHADSGGAVTVNGTRPILSPERSMKPLEGETPSG